MNVILYTTHCPQCNILTKKLDLAGVEYSVCDDPQEILKLGFMSAPILKVDDEIYLFKEAVLWIDDYVYEHQEENQDNAD